MSIYLLNREHNNCTLLVPQYQQFCISIHEAHKNEKYNHQPIEYNKKESLFVSVNLYLSIF